MIALDTLKLADPLAAQALTLVVKILPTPADAVGPRDDRPLTLALGVPNEVPILVQGQLGQLDALLSQAWQQLARVYTQAADADVAAEAKAALTDPTAGSSADNLAAPTKKEATQHPSAPNPDSTLTLF